MPIYWRWQESRAIQETVLDQGKGSAVLGTSPAGRGVPCLLPRLGLLTSSSLPVAVFVKCPLETPK